MISKVRVSSLDRASDAIDLVAATVDAPGLVERAIFGEDLVDGRAPTRGVVFKPVEPDRLVEAIAQVVARPR